ncbi:MAG: hypothetical protein ACYTDY_09535, partial [Planctomycetota bacterium]
RCAAPVPACARGPSGSAERPRLERRQLSNELMEKGVVHYSQRYSHVMGVRSDFVVWEREQLAQGKILRPTTYTLD